MRDYEIYELRDQKKRYLELLLLADEQEEMIDRYLDRGQLFALYETGELRAVCVITDEGEGRCELKNMATVVAYQRQGYGKYLLEQMLKRFASHFDEMLVGTGESESTLAFYQSCGFKAHHRVPNFFNEHYDHPIIENGVQLVDMIYLSRKL